MAEASRTLVDVAGVNKSFGAGPAATRALIDVSLTIQAGEFFTLLGPSGCGKTTLLRMLAGFEHPESGTIAIDGRDVLADPPFRRPVNIVFQSYALFPHLTVARNIGFGLARQGTGRAERAERVETMLRLVRLEALANRRPAALSGGQQQRVALARALAPRPKLVLLDEPLSALDPNLRRGMQDELKHIQRETGIAFLLVTHDQEEALSMSDRIAVMDAGRVLQIGVPAAIHDRPASRFVAAFMGANVLPGARVGLEAAHVAIRPEHVTLRREVKGDTGLRGHVRSLAYRGARTSCVVTLDTGEAVTADIETGRPECAGLARGARVTCRFAPNALVSLEDA